MGHGLAAISMQANVALHLMRDEPSAAGDALEAISSSSQEALDELRATLTGVRQDLDPGRTPAPGLDDVPQLSRRVEEAGAGVTLEIRGERPVVSAAADLAGYRVVQEALTNVLRHGPTKKATVRIGYADEAISVLVSNPLPPAATPANRPGRGLGLLGMKECVTGLGGTFHAGPTGGRFEVVATIPARQRGDR